MELSSGVIEGLQSAGDSLTLPDKLFALLLEGVFDILLQKDTEDNLFSNISGVSISVFKQCYYGVTALVLEVVKYNADKSSLSATLEECKWINDRIDFLSRKIEDNKSDLQIMLARIGHNHPHIVDVDWRLDYTVKNSCLDKVNEPSYLINLKTQEPGKQGNLQFSCSVDELQDLVNKLKDASKSLEKASQG